MCVVSSSVRGLLVRWDISDFQGISLNGSYRKTDGEVASFQWKVPERRGLELVPLSSCRKLETPVRSAGSWLMKTDVF